MIRWKTGRNTKRSGDDDDHDEVDHDNINDNDNKDDDDDDDDDDDTNDDDKGGWCLCLLVWIFFEASACTRECCSFSSSITCTNLFVAYIRDMLMNS